MSISTVILLFFGFHGGSFRLTMFRSFLLALDPFVHYVKILSFGSGSFHVGYSWADQYVISTKMLLFLNSKLFVYHLYSQRQTSKHSQHRRTTLHHLFLFLSNRPTNNFSYLQNKVSVIIIYFLIVPWAEKRLQLSGSQMLVVGK
jgi:hypothetical protein